MCLGQLSLVFYILLLADWNGSIIFSLFKVQGDDLDQRNHHELKLTDHVVQVIERVIKNIICEKVNIDELQLSFFTGPGTTDAIFILRQLQETYLAKHRKLYMAMVE